MVFIHYSSSSPYDLFPLAWIIFLITTFTFTQVYYYYSGSTYTEMSRSVCFVLSPPLLTLSKSFEKPHCHLNRIINTMADFFHLKNTARLHTSLSLSAALTLVYAFVTFRFDYCKAVLLWLPVYGLNKLLYAQNWDDAAGIPVSTILWELIPHTTQSLIDSLFASTYCTVQNTQYGQRFVNAWQSYLYVGLHQTIGITQLSRMFDYCLE